MSRIDIYTPGNKSSNRDAALVCLKGLTSLRPNRSEQTKVKKKKKKKNGSLLFSFLSNQMDYVTLNRSTKDLACIPGVPSSSSRIPRYFYFYGVYIHSDRPQLRSEFFLSKLVTFNDFCDE